MHPSIRKTMDENAAKRREREQQRLERNAEIAAKTRQARGIGPEDRRGA